MSFLTSLLTALWPVDFEGEPKHVIRWRQTVAAVLMALVLTQGFSVAFALGAVPGFSGFASNSKADRSLMVQLEEQIVRTKQRFCTGLMMGNRDATEAARELLRKYTQEYQLYFVIPPPIPSCKELLVPIEG